MTGMSLNDLSSLAEIISACTIITGLTFGIFQILAHRTDQKNAIAANLCQTFANSELSSAVNLLHQLEDGASAEELKKGGPEFEKAAVVVSTSFETMGLLVYRRIAPVDLVMELAGGMCASMFRKLEKSIQDKRRELNQPSWAEWFEWLALLAPEYKKQTTSAASKVSSWRR
jgi:hypothetical protein